MKRIVLIITIGILCANTHSFSQKIQTYSGAFEGGTATYQYYENEQYERVYHGDFKFQSEGLTVTGKFSHSKKNGTWKATNNSSNTFVYGGKLFQVASGQYVKGNREGTWTYQKSIDGKIRIQSIAHFKNNLKVGAYEYKNGTFSMKYNLNDEGFVDGEYVATDTYTQHIAKFKNGVMYFSLYRNPSNGEIKEKIDIHEAVNEFFSLYDTTNQVAIFPKYELNKYYGFIWRKCTSCWSKDYSPYEIYDDSGLTHEEDLVTQKKYLKDVPFVLEKRTEFETRYNYLLGRDYPLNFWDGVDGRYGGDIYYGVHFFFDFEIGSNKTQPELMRSIVYKHLKKE